MKKFKNCVKNYSKAKNDKGFLLLVLVLAIALAGVIFATIYSQRARSGRQTIQNVEKQKEYMEKKLEDNLNVLQNRLMFTNDNCRSNKNGLVSWVAHYPLSNSRLSDHISAKRISEAFFDKTQW